MISSTVITKALRKAGIPRTSLRTYYKDTLAEYGEPYYVAAGPGYRVERERHSNSVTFVFEGKGIREYKLKQISEYLKKAKDIILSLGYSIELEESSLLVVDMSKNNNTISNGK